MVHNPLDLDTILESVFEFLDTNTLKVCRTVNALWSIEAIKKLFQKSFIKVPSNFYSGTPLLSRRQKRALKNSLAFLIDSFNTERIPRRYVQINEFRDIQILQSIFPSDHQFWLSIREIEYNDNTPPPVSQITKFLCQLPNLDSFSSQYMFNMYDDPSLWDLNQLEPFIKAKKSHLITHYSCSFNLDFIHESYGPDPVEHLEKVSSLDTKFSQLFVSLYGRHYHQNMWSTTLWSRLGQSLTKIFQSSASTLEHLSLCHEVGFFRQLKYSRLDNLTAMTLFLNSGDPTALVGLRFPEYFPKLKSLTLQIDGEEDIFPKDMWETVLPDVGVCTTVTDLGIFCWDIDLASVAKAFPAVKNLRLVNILDFYAMAKDTWIAYKQLVVLELNLMVELGELGNTFPFIDAALTGFSLETVKQLYKARDKLDDYDRLEIESKREFPSLLDLKELQYFKLHFNCARLESLLLIPKSFQLISEVAGQFALRPLSSKLDIILEASGRSEALDLRFQALLKPMERFC